MRNKKIKILSILILTLQLYNCKAQILQATNSDFANQIIGTWISEDDNSLKLEFTENNQMYQFVNQQVQNEVFNYEVNANCGSNTSNGFDDYLKIYNNSSDETCHIINSISIIDNGDTILSLTTERGTLEIYIKE